MTNIQYVTTFDDRKQGVILPLNDYRRVEVFLINQLSLSLLDIAFDYLELSENLVKFLKLLVKCSKNINELENENFEVTFFKDEIAKISPGKTFEAKQRFIQDRLSDLPILKKAVIHILDENRKVGVTYRLNFLETVLNSTREFLNQSFFDLVEVTELTIFAQKFNYSEAENSNRRFKELIKILEKNLNEKLSDKMINERAEQVLASQRSLKK